VLPLDNRVARLCLNDCHHCGYCLASTSNSMKKRRCPSSFSSFQDPRSSSSSIKTTTTLFSDSEPKPKKLFLSVSDPTTNPPQSPEDARTGIIPVTPSSHTGLQVSDPTQSPCSGDVSSVDLTKEDTPNSKVDTLY
jgi:hypothetical protein